MSVFLRTQVSLSRSAAYIFGDQGARRFGNRKALEGQSNCEGAQKSRGLILEHFDGCSRSLESFPYIYLHVTERDDDVRADGGVGGFAEDGEQELEVRRAA